MDNVVCKLSFKANLKPTFIVKNSKRFNNIASSFSCETKQFPNSAYELYISEVKKQAGKPSQMAFHLNMTPLEDNSKNVYISNLLEDDFEKLTDSQIVKKYAKIFNVLHYRDLLINKLPDIKAEYERSIKLIESLKPNATTIKEKKLIEQLETTINSLKEKYNNINKIARENIKKAIKGNDELKEFTSDIL